MRSSKYVLLSAVLLLAVASGSPAVAQTPNFPWVQIESTSVNLGIGGQSGDGIRYSCTTTTTARFDRSRTLLAVATSGEFSPFATIPTRVGTMPAPIR